MDVRERMVEERVLLMTKEANIKTPFSQLKYERIIDGNNDNPTDIQWGYFVDDNDESYFGKPLIFYPIRQTQGESIQLLPSTTSHVEVTEYNIPSNSVALASATSSYNINFYAENNEYGALNDPSDNGFTKTLFESGKKETIPFGVIRV